MAGTTSSKLLLVILLGVFGPPAVAVVWALVLRAFVVEAMLVPSDAMQPTLLLYDKMLFKKWTRRAARGAVVVFDYPDPDPANDRQQYVKRVIGLPGDTLVFEQNVPIINGWPVPRCRVGEGMLHDQTSGPHAAEIFVEFLAGQTYLIAVDPASSQVDGPYAVGPDEIFLLGDNRNRSWDSRAWRRKAIRVPQSNVQGQFWFLYSPRQRLGIRPSTPVLPTSVARLQPELARCLREAPDPAQTFPPAAL